MAMDGEQAGTKTKTIRRENVPPHERSFRPSAASAVAVVDAANGRAAGFCRRLLAFLRASAALEKVCAIFSGKKFLPNEAHCERPA